MSARQKLNRAHWVGNLSLAAFLGWICGSFPVFVIAAAVLVVGSCLAGEIRPGRTRRR